MHDSSTIVAPAAHVDLPPCPTCGDSVDNLEGAGERMWAWPCGHPVSPIIGAGGVTGAIILRPRTETA